MLLRSMMVVFVFSLGAGVFQPTPGDRGQRLDLPAAIKISLAGDVSAQGGKIPLEVTFANQLEAEQTIENVDYQFFLLRSNGDQIHDSLTVTAELRDITLKNYSGTDYPGVFVAPGKIRAGEEYYLVVVVNNLSSLLKFKAVE